MAKYWQYQSFWELSPLNRVKKALGPNFFVRSIGVDGYGHPIWGRISIEQALETLHSGGSVCLGHLSENKIRLIRNGSSKAFEERCEKWMAIGLQIERSMLTSTYGGVKFCSVDPEFYNYFL